LVIILSITENKLVAGAGHIDRSDYGANVSKYRKAGVTGR